jgi:hypothetical protein
VKPSHFLLFGLVTLPACGSGGDTPACPELPRFDIRVASERAAPAVLAARRAAIEAGCITAPADPAAASGGGGNEPDPAAGDAGAASSP